jgi:hypothetical protein
VRDCQFGAEFVCWAVELHADCPHYDATNIAQLAQFFTLNTPETAVVEIIITAYHLQNLQPSSRDLLVALKFCNCGCDDHTH